MGGRSSDAFFSNMMNNMFGGRGMFGGNNFWGFGGQARVECSRTCDDIMDDASNTDDCLNEVRYMGQRNCIFPQRSCQRSCMKMEEEDYCSPGCLESLGQDPSTFDSFEICRYSLKKNLACRTHHDSCAKRCPAGVTEEVTLECPDECLPIADQDYNTCWSEMKASRTCSKYKGCLDKCMSNDTCPEECNIAKILGGYKACITFISNFPMCQKHKDCYDNCPKDFIDENVIETVTEKEDEEEQDEEEGKDSKGEDDDDDVEENRRGILDRLFEMFSNMHQESFQIGFNRITDQVSEIANIYVNTLDDLFDDEEDDGDDSKRGFGFTNIFDRFDSFKPDFNNLADKLTSGAEIYVNSLADLVKEIETDWEPISQELGNAGEALVSIFFNQTKIEGVGKDLTEAFTNLLENIDSSILEPIVNGSATDGIIDGFEIVGRHFTNLTDDLDLGEAIDTIGDVVGDTLGDLGETIGDHFENIEESFGFGNIIDTVQEMGQDLIDTDMFKSLGDAMADTWGIDWSIDDILEW